MCNVMSGAAWITWSKATICLPVSMLQIPMPDEVTATTSAPSRRISKSNGWLSRPMVISRTRSPVRPSTTTKLRPETKNTFASADIATLDSMLSASTILCNSPVAAVQMATAESQPPVTSHVPHEEIANAQTGPPGCLSSWSARSPAVSQMTARESSKTDTLVQNHLPPGGTRATVCESMPRSKKRCNRSPETLQITTWLSEQSARRRSLSGKISEPIMFTLGGLVQKACKRLSERASQRFALCIVVVRSLIPPGRNLMT
mmetsp:Transcript_75415/g.219041  ORF Transcript_75415/g.219041 Transcript_75415/m.219041 type:complete len:260 (+) Transcript_75415:393-1172(+)